MLFVRYPLTMYCCACLSIEVSQRNYLRNWSTDFVRNLCTHSEICEGILKGYYPQFLYFFAISLAFSRNPSRFFSGIYRFLLGFLQEFLRGFSRDFLNWNSSRFFFSQIFAGLHSEIPAGILLKVSAGVPLEIPSDIFAGASSGIPSEIPIFVFQEFLLEFLQRYLEAFFRAFLQLFFWNIVPEIFSAVFFLIFFSKNYSLAFLLKLH